MTQQNDVAAEVYHEAREQENVPAPEGTAANTPEDPEVVDDPELEEGEGEYPEAEGHAIAQITTSMEWLLDLRRTIAREGVSQHDIQAVHDIKASLEAVDVTFGTVPALEHYPVRSYTAERSSVNLDMGMESIARTILQTVKRWIQKLIEYIQKLYRWIKKTLFGESRFEAKFEALAESIATARMGREAVAQKRRTATGKDLEKEITRLRQDLLTDSELVKSPLQLAALGNPEQVAAVTTLTNHTRSLVGQTQTMVSQFERFLSDESVDATTFDDRSFTLAGMMADDANVLKTPMPQRDYLKQHLKHDIFDQPVPSVAWKVSHYDYIQDAYADLSKRLQKIRRMDGAEDVQVVAEVLSGISKNVDTMARMGLFFYEFNRMKLKSLAALYTYQNAAFSVVYKDATKHAIDQREQEALEKVFDDTVRRLKALQGGSSDPTVHAKMDQREQKRQEAELDQMANDREKSPYHSKMF